MGFLDDISKAADSIKKTTDGVESDIEDVFNLFGSRKKKAARSAESAVKNAVDSAESAAKNASETAEKLFKNTANSAQSAAQRQTELRDKRVIAA